MNKNISYKNLGKNFWLHFVIMFTSAFIDNFLKNAIIISALFTHRNELNLLLTMMAPLSAAIFILPFILFSHVAGQLNDFWDKKGLIVYCKLLELMVGITVIFILPHGHWGALLFCLFLLGVHSTFYGPAKYSIIEHLVAKKLLVSATAWIEAGTFLAILFGTMLGATIVSITNGIYWVGPIMVVLSLSSLLLASMLPSYLKQINLHQKNFSILINPVKSNWNFFKKISKHHHLMVVIVGISFFFFIGSWIITMLPNLVKSGMKGSEFDVSIIFAIFSIGIALGSLVYEKTLKHFKIAACRDILMLLGLLFMGFILILLATIFSVIDSLIYLRIGVMILFFLLSFFSGFFSTPLYVLLQELPSLEWKSQAIAFNNVINAIFMIVASLFMMIMLAFHWSQISIFIAAFFCWIIFLIYFLNYYAASFYLFGALVFVKLFYRLKVIGAEHIPQRGPILFVSNHLSFIDWVLLIAAIPFRELTFVVWYRYFNLPVIKKLFQHQHHIPIAGKHENLVYFKESFPLILQSLASEKAIVFFPEGSVSPNGDLQVLKTGLLNIIADYKGPIIPIVIKGLWGSVWSTDPLRFQGKKILARWQQRLLVEVIIGEPLTIKRDQYFLTELDKIFRKL